MGCRRTVYFLIKQTKFIRTNKKTIKQRIKSKCRLHKTMKICPSRVVKPNLG